MYYDPIVNETREAGRKMAEESNYDIHEFFNNLRESQKQYDKERFQNLNSLQLNMKNHSMSN
ncbi:MAG: hypothetical protein C4527_26970 [Candidatus Omnitrophota bacterium]|jgi:hypothetical protein|nr:MAG: hypothetical protein C4527_26970 [Candidatus Omnitrophota bacterium]